MSPARLPYALSTVGTLTPASAATSSSRMSERSREPSSRTAASGTRRRVSSADRARAHPQRC